MRLGSASLSSTHVGYPVDSRKRRRTVVGGGAKEPEKPTGIPAVRGEEKGLEWVVMVEIDRKKGKSVV